MTKVSIMEGDDLMSHRDVRYLAVEGSREATKRNSYLPPLKRNRVARGEPKARALAVRRVAILFNNSIYARLFGPFRFNRDIPRHIYNYNPTALKMLLEKNGFKIKKIKHLSAGSFFTSLYHLLDYKFGIKLRVLNNIGLHILFYPLDWIVNILGFGDNIHLTVRK